MKVRLLRKIRKRFSWYYRSDTTPILLDHKHKEVIIFHEEYLKDKRTLPCEIPFQEVQRRHLMSTILEPFGIYASEYFYHSTTKNLRREINNKTKPEIKKVIPPCDNIPPEFDGDYLCILEQDNVCNSTTRKYIVLTLAMNKWVIPSNEFGEVISWSKLPNI